MAYKNKYNSLHWLLSNRARRELRDYEFYNYMKAYTPSNFKTYALTISYEDLKYPGRLVFKHKTGEAHKNILIFDLITIDGAFFLYSLRTVIRQDGYIYVDSDAIGSFESMDTALADESFNYLIHNSNHYDLFVEHTRYGLLKASTFSFTDGDSIVNVEDIYRNTSYLHKTLHFNVDDSTVYDYNLKPVSSDLDDEITYININASSNNTTLIDFSQNDTTNDDKILHKQYLTINDSIQPFVINSGTANVVEYYNKPTYDMFINIITKDKYGKDKQENRTNECNI